MPDQLDAAHVLRFEEQGGSLASRRAADGSGAARLCGEPPVLLRATLNERLAGAVTEDLAASVLDVAIPWAKRPARGGDGSTCNAAHHSADRTSNHGPGDDAGRGPRGLLRGLTSRRCEADDSCENDGGRAIGVTLSVALGSSEGGRAPGRAARSSPLKPIYAILGRTRRQQHARSESLRVCCAARAPRRV
jgi:hypothetical protein